MALKRPPTHRVDAPAVLVLPDDPAWDFEKIEAEKKAMKEADADPRQHPYTLFHSGASRYDLQAATSVLGEQRCAEDYLDESKAPVRIKLRRLTYQQYYEVQGLLRRDLQEQAWQLATEYGIESIEGAGWKVQHGPGGKILPEVMQDIVNADTEAPIWIGIAVWKTSGRLSEAEKKA